MALRRLRQDIATSWKRTLYVMFVAQLITAIGFSSIFPFLPLYVEELGAATSLSVELLAGLVFSAQALTMAIASPIWGMLADRHGRKLMVERAMFGGTVILLLMAFVRSAEELVLLRALQGLITGTVGAASALVASVAPREHTGYAMGLLQVGLGTGLALGPLIGGVVADAIGYYAAFYVTAALLFIAGLLVLLGVEENFVPADSPDGEAGGLIEEWRHILSATGVLITYGLRFSVQLGRMMIVPIAPLFVQVLLGDSAHVNTFTGLVVASAAATTTLSAVYLGRLGDRIGHRRILILTTLLAALLYLPQSLVTQGWQLLVLQALVGVAMGGIVPAISALLARYTREGEEGAVYGLDNSITSGARAAAPLLGAAVAVWFGLRATFATTALILLGAGLLAAMGLPRPARPRQAGSARAL
ncbi:MAG: MFS transporter [Anaerolineae bacterium]|jgi:DHA1 family multidrug resistance protein-like MFS transporter